MKTKTIGTWMVALALACLPAAAAVPDQLSMQVTGHISTAVDGTVSGYALDKPELLSKDVIALIDTSVRAWRFEPVMKDGKAVPETATMSLALVAKKTGDDQYRTAIRSASFSGNEVAISGVTMTPPPYPPDAARAGVGGTVYLVVLVDDHGAVERAAVEEVDLDSDSKALSRTRLRRALADAAVAQSKQWKFTAPPSGADAMARTVRVPTEFTMMADGRDPSRYGQWKAYFPGPRTTVPWLKDTRADAAPIAASAGAVQPIQPALVLKTPLDAS